MFERPASHSSKDRLSGRFSHLCPKAEIVVLPERLQQLPRRDPERLREPEYCADLRLVPSVLKLADLNDVQSRIAPRGLPESIPALPFPAGSGSFLDGQSFIFRSAS